MPMATPSFRSLLFAACGSLLLAGCTSLPSLEGRQASTALTGTADTRIGKVAQALTATHPDLSGIYALSNPREAFAARAVLARAADRSLDVQYYIWHADTTGFLLFEDLWNAAERGVRVRLLLDDNGVGGLDPVLAALDSHANIEVRLFNPYANRGFKAIGYLSDFDRLNRRMHNKSFSVDTQVTIVGGRNVGDEYFGAGEGVAFADLDVMAVGPIATEVAASFDQYWNSESAYPADRILDKGEAEGVSALKVRFAEVRASPEATRYIEAVRATELVTKLVAGQLRFEWARARLVADEPHKTLGQAQNEELMLAKLAEVIGTPAKQLDLVSPYFVPGKKGTEYFSGLAQSGIAVRIITNSLAATDVAAVHAGYAKRREPLLQSGAHIYELKPNAGDKKERDGGSGSVVGSSSASLHAKTFSVDRNRVFIGSFNFDPRSIHLNTEMGIVIDSPNLGEELSGGLDRGIGQIAYEVVLAKGGDLEWIERTAEGERRYDKEPKTTAMKRFNVGFLELLPIESLL